MNPPRIRRVRFRRERTTTSSSSEEEEEQEGEEEKRRKRKKIRARAARRRSRFAETSRCKIAGRDRQVQSFVFPTIGLVIFPPGR